MRVLVVGAYGFIGQHIANGLLQAGHEVVAGGRNLALGQRLLPDAEWLRCDFNTDLTPEIWAPRLASVDAVVNCVGILQTTLSDTHERVHVTAPTALFRAAAAIGVRRVIQLSALGAEPETGTAYSDSKSEADTALKAMDLDWVILKPSLVYAAGSYGGTTLIRSLAGLPAVIPLINNGAYRFQPVAMGDLVEAVVRLIAPDAPAKVELIISGPEEKSLADIVRLTRRWLTFPDAIYVNVPRALARPVLWLGDIAGWFGLPTAFRGASMRQMELGNTGSPDRFIAATGIQPMKMEAALARHPSTLQDRLHARSAFAVTLLRVVLGLFWISSGFITLLPATWIAAVGHLTNDGLSLKLAQALTFLGALADMALGLPFLIGWQVRLFGALQLSLMGFYVVFLTLFSPYMWLDPFGAVMKIFPAFAATLIVMAWAELR